MGTIICFTEVSEQENKQAYISQKLLNFGRKPDVHSDQKEANDIAQKIAASANTVIPVEDPAKLATLPEKRQKEIMVDIQRFRKHIDKVSPLLKDEHRTDQKEDVCTCLSDDYMEFKKGTAVLIQKTNKATIYYFQTECLVDPSGDVKIEIHNEPRTLREGKKELPTLGKDLSWQLILKKMFTGLAGKIGGGIGAQILKLIFPGYDSFDYKQCIEDIHKIVKEEIIDDTIQTKAGDINGIILDAKERSDYLSSLSSNDEAIDLFLKYTYDINKDLGVLCHDKYVRNALAIIIFGYQTKIVMYQQVAMLRPDPQNSKEAKQSIPEACRTVVDLLDTQNKAIRKELLATRLSKITKGSYGTAGYNYSETRMYVKDSVSGFYEEWTLRCGSDEAENNCNKTYNEQVRYVTENYNRTLDNDFAFLTEAISSFNSILKNPLAKN